VRWPNSRRFQKEPSPVLQTIEESMEQVVVCARVLLWRRLGKRCCMSYHYIAIPPFRELFDCPSYNNIGSKMCSFRLKAY
jgi:hypothetical protein